MARRQETSIHFAPSTGDGAEERIYSMSTGPGPTRKADGSSVDDISDLLVDDDSQKGKVVSEQPIDDGLDVMLETPGPMLVNTFLPPPPAPPTGLSSEESESADAEEAGGPTNLAYEDLLAKLVLPAKAPEPEPAMPALASPLSLAEPDEAPTPIPSISPFNRSNAPSLQLTSPSDERTLVTDNPLVAEEQEAAVREGRSIQREQPSLVHEDVHSMPTEPVATVNGIAKSRLVYLMLGGILVLFGMILAVLVMKLIMPTPSPAPVVITPSPQPSPPPPAKVEPLPPSSPPSQVAPTQPKAGQEAPSGDAVEGEYEKPQPKHRPSHPKAVAPKPAPVAVPKPAPTPKATAPTPKAAPAPAVKPAKPEGKKKPGKSSGWSDPFDN
jgi:hypothetical protein